jgi:uracil-DNA glycosylase family 4
VRPLPLYDAAPIACAADVPELRRDPACTRCELGAQPRVHNRCIPPSAHVPAGVAAPVLLVVVDYPGRAEDSACRPLVGGTGKYLHEQLVGLWPGVIVVTNAVGCFPGGDGVQPKHADACRGYLAGVLQSAAPDRVLAMGTWAIYGLLGRKVAPMSARGGYGWHRRDDGVWVPVYLFPNPLNALRNRFFARDIEADLRVALCDSLPAKPNWKRTTQLVESENDAALAREVLRAARGFSFDVETSGVLHEPGFRVETITLWPFGSRLGFTWDRPAIESGARGALATVLADPSIAKAGHNVKYDALSCECDPLLGVRVQGIELDTLLVRKLLEPESAGDLETCAELVGEGGHKIDAQTALAPILDDLVALAGEPHRKPLVSGKARKPYEPVVLHAPVPRATLDLIHAKRAKPITFAYRWLDSRTRAQYNARDTASTDALRAALVPKIEARGSLARVWREVVRPAMWASTEMERVGVSADRERARHFEQFLTAALVPVDKQLAQYTPAGFNLNSQPQLAKLLFETLQLPVLRRTESGGPSTADEVLEQLGEEHEFPRLLREHRRLATMRGTFAVGVPSHILSDGRIHPSWLLHGAATGRLSCRDPNLMNIPRTSDAEEHTEGKLARDMFVAPAGRALVSCDYSQLELRVAALISGDPVMIAMFKGGMDFHLETARRIAKVAWNIEPERWERLTKEQRKPYRDVAKIVNFSVHYGRGARQLAKMIGGGCTKQQAQLVIDSILGEFRVLRECIGRHRQDCLRDGGAWTYWRGERARFRPLPAIGEQGDDAAGRRGNAERSAWNSPVQGSSAEYATASLWPVSERFRRERVPAQLVLTVHDQLMAECDKAAIAETVGIMREEMLRHWSGDVPLVVDTDVGEAWGSLEPFGVAA